MDLLMDVYNLCNYCFSDELWYNFFIPIICLAFVATVPVIIRYICFGKR